eukprot:2365710-Pleurochrysis_carterae.AAC.1
MQACSAPRASASAAPVRRQRRCSPSRSRACAREQADRTVDATLRLARCSFADFRKAASAERVRRS